MNKLLLALGLASLGSSVCAADFSLEALKAGDIGVKAEAVIVPVPPAPVVQLQATSELVSRFSQVKKELAQLGTDTTWLRFDIDKLETAARFIAQTSSYEPFFQNDLRRMVFNLTGYDTDARRIEGEIKKLLELAQKDQELNRIARDMDVDANNLLSGIQFDLVSSAQRLEWTVRRVRPALIGYDAQWVVRDIVRYSRSFVDEVRGISWDTQALISKTQP